MKQRFIIIGVLLVLVAIVIALMPAKQAEIQLLDCQIIGTDPGFAYCMDYTGRQWGIATKQQLSQGDVVRLIVQDNAIVFYKVLIRKDVQSFPFLWLC